ncbi:MAG: 23S rRNA (uracil(1939)-C(5))-methyltransferase RlmD [Defluviitaleaceae bacterium]|nr:23S rRNA (uracil(1939)-C(5))-methyltransferase RlmD [Defluviitaleaceae bacterium]
MKKYSVSEILIDNIRFPNIGLGAVDSLPIEVKGALPGQRLSIRLVKKGKINKGQVLEVLQPAPREIVPACPVFGLCGGCAFQHIPYDYEVELKTQMVKEIFADFSMDDKFLSTLPAITAYGYRNKMEYSFGDDGEGGNLTLGMRKKGSYYEAVDASGCLLCHGDFGKIQSATLAYFKGVGAHFFHRRKGVGSLRHLVIRHGVNTGELLVNLVTAGDGDYSDYTRLLLDLPLDGAIVGILNTINNSLADAVRPEEVKILHGRDYFNESFVNSDMRYKIPAFSFFQTNTGMTEALYAAIANCTGDLADKTVFDLYCGAGTIGLYLAKTAGAGRVVGVEIVEDAIISARENARLSGVDCDFIVGDVRKIVKELDGAPDVIILDPPREGVAPKAIPDILAFGAKKIVYVSCKPTSLAANLPAFLEGGYTVGKVQCVDMFPRTANVEVVMELCRT